MRYVIGAVLSVVIWVASAAASEPSLYTEVVREVAGQNQFLFSEVVVTDPALLDPGTPPSAETFPDGVVPCDYNERENYRPFTPGEC